MDLSADKILFASDYPHWDGMFPHVVSTIRGRKDISDEAKAQILGQNAKRFYGWQWAAVTVWLHFPESFRQHGIRLITLCRV